MAKCTKAHRETLGCRSIQWCNRCIFRSMHWCNQENCNIVWNSLISWCHNGLGWYSLISYWCHNGLGTVAATHGCFFTKSPLAKEKFWDSIPVKVWQRPASGRSAYKPSSHVSCGPAVHKNHRRKKTESNRNQSTTDWSQKPYSKSYVGRKKSQQGSCRQQSHWTTLTKIVYGLLCGLSWNKALCTRPASSWLKVRCYADCSVRSLISWSKGRVFFFVADFFESCSIRSKKHKHHYCGSPAARFPHQCPLGPVIQRKNINGGLQFKAWPPSPSSNGCVFPVAQLIHAMLIALVSVNRGSWTLIFEKSSSESIIMAPPRLVCSRWMPLVNWQRKNPPKKIPSVMYPVVLSVSSSATLHAYWLIARLLLQD